MSFQIPKKPSLESQIETHLHILGDETLVFFLECETIPFIACIISFLPTARGSKIIGQFKANLASEIVLFLAGSTDQRSMSLEAMLDEVKHWSEQAKTTLKKPGVKLNTANLLEGLDKNFQKRVLKELQSRSPELARSLDLQLIKFETLFLLNARDMSKILAQISDSELSVLLCNSSQKAVIFLKTAVSQSRIDRVCENPVAVPNVSAAEQKCLSVARRLGLLEDILEPRV